MSNAIKLGNKCYVIASENNHVMPIVITEANLQQVQMYWNIIYFATEDLAKKNSMVKNNKNTQFYY